MSHTPIAILVLGGGPDRERSVSLKSAAEVAAALRSAGHQTVERDILPDDLSALHETFDVVFPVLHGAWGEGGPLQRILAEQGVPFVGSREAAAALAMDKVAAKHAAETVGVRTPSSQVLRSPDDVLQLDPPVVVKPPAEGSSVGVYICHDQQAIADARAELHGQYRQVLVEQFITGAEATFGILDEQVLPGIRIRPATAFYDYQAKYDRNDTRYEFDLDLLPKKIAADALKVHQAIGAAHLSRVDFIIDSDGVGWFIEINTMPGFTTHSLLPMAARQAGIDMPALVDRLVRLALRDADRR